MQPDRRCSCEFQEHVSQLFRSLNPKPLHNTLSLLSLPLPAVAAAALRYCIGAGLAMVEMKVLLALSARHYTFVCDNNTEWTQAIGKVPKVRMPCKSDQHVYSCISRHACLHGLSVLAALAFCVASLYCMCCQEQNLRHARIAISAVLLAAAKNLTCVCCCSILVLCRTGCLWWSSPFQLEQWCLPAGFRHQSRIEQTTGSLGCLAVTSEGDVHFTDASCAGLPAQFGLSAVWAATTC
jgi:hypothetical protein